MRQGLVLAALLGLGLVVTFLALAGSDPDGWGLRVDHAPRTVRPPVPGAAWGTAGWWTPPALLTLGDPATSGRSAWSGDFDAAPAVAYDIDGDGTNEVIAHSNDTRVHVYDSRTGRLVASLGTTYPPDWYVERVLNAVSVGVLAPGEPPSLVVANHAAYVAAWRFDPSRSTADKFAFTRTWEVRPGTSFMPNPSMDARAVLADFDGDGAMEVLVQNEEVGLYALRGADGAVLWDHPWAGGNANPVAADLDGDGTPEAIFASDTGIVCAFHGMTGHTRWCFDARKHGVTPASISVSPTVAELDGKAPREVLFTARDAHAGEPGTYDENHLAIFAIRDGTLLWKRQPEWAHPLSYTQLAVVDVTGDGAPEILGMDWNTMGHMPGNWENLGPAHVFALDAAGEDVWVRTVDAWWSNKDIAVGDFDQDGALEVLANGARDGDDGLWRFDARNGQPEAFLTVAPWKLERGPVVLDLGRGTMQLVLPVEPNDGTQRRGGLRVFDLGAAWSAPWPGYAT